MNTYFPYQFCINLHLASGQLLFPRYLRELSERLYYDKQDELESFFTADLKDAPIISQSEIDYYQFLVHNSLNFQLHKQDFEAFEQTLEVVRHRMQGLRNAQADFDLRAWEGFLAFFEVAFLRSMRHVPLERFEQQLDGLNWDLYKGEFLARLSQLIGYVYLREDDEEQAAKARLWLQKAVYESVAEERLTVYLMLGEYFLRKPNENTASQIADLVEKLRQEQVKPELKDLFKAAAFQLDLQGFQLQTGGAEKGQSQEVYGTDQVDKLRVRYEKFTEVNEFPDFVVNELATIVAMHYGQLADSTEEDKEREPIAEKATSLMEEVVTRVDEKHWPDQAMRYRLLRAMVSAQSRRAKTEKELKEILTHYRRRLHYPNFLEASRVFMLIHDINGNGIKAMDLFADIFKQGHKRLEQGGFSLLLGGLTVSNDILGRESRKSGVSWIVEHLKTFFEHIKEAIEIIPDHLETLGEDAIEQFRKAFTTFEPISHFNIFTYFSYQLYQMKMLRIGTLLSKDKVSETLINRLISNFTNENSPMSFIAADWEEFKEVPNSVRNKTLNKCINISKGDLPLAAEHLDFSYRNLRSYITFKEVNRLGFFLEISQTNNRQLEQGIRFMFYDLYKKGTIFEVVFDMPKFLVKYAKKGFYSSDLEKELNIKGTTAKKYIKIMTEIGLIKQDKTTGRKHFYRLIRENVMKRLGQDQTTWIKPEA